MIPENSTVFIATDTNEFHFFDSLQSHFNLIFLKDCLPILKELGLNTNLYPLVDQLVASREGFSLHHCRVPSVPTVQGCKPITWPKRMLQESKKAQLQPGLMSKELPMTLPS